MPGPGLDGRSGSLDQPLVPEEAVLLDPSQALEVELLAVHVDEPVAAPCRIIMFCSLVVSQNGTPA
jgi:hypothetical protein